MLAKATPDWKKQIGLELYTVRGLLSKDFEGTLAKVAEIGYKEVEPVGYGGLSPKQFRDLLDRYGLSAPSTHAGATEGPDLEQQLEGHRAMGIKYTEIRAPQPSGPRPARTEEWAKRSAAEYNRYGAITRKFGMKILIHNHAGEFEKLENSQKTQYDVLLAETDPALVAMQLDIGWARVAGQDVLKMFRKHPGRYELWHIKDVIGLKNAEPGKRPKTTFVPVGQGEIDYKPLFAAAKLAGMKYFVVEQDNAGQNGGDALADARANYEGLAKKVLSGAKR
jgi:sugar phosphate isomerase/epimerase